jgi:hypothetical protein
MKQQAAVEWLIEQVKSKEWQDMFIWHKEEAFEKAKQMEKQQMMEAFQRGINKTEQNKSAYYSSKRFHKKYF